MSFEISDNLWVGFQLMSRNFGPLMDNKVLLDWAVLDYRWQDALGIRLGRLKTPYGLYNANLDVDFARITILLPGEVVSLQIIRWQVLPLRIGSYISLRPQLPFK